MRLIDADALREGLQRCIRQEEEPYLAGALIGIRMVLDESPTIECAACEHYEPGAYVEACADCYCCSSFERRQP